MLPDVVGGLTAATRREMDKGIGVFTWTNVMNRGGMFVTLIRRGLLQASTRPHPHSSVREASITDVC